MAFQRLRRFSFGRPDLDRDVDEELELHVELLTDELIEKGFQPQAAREEAERRFGNAETYGETCRQIHARRHTARRRHEWGRGVLGDLKLAFRTLAKSPGYTTVAVLTLALGLGATTVLFSVVDAVVLRPFPFPEPERLMVIRETNGPYRHVPPSPANFLAWREETTSFERMAALYHTDLSLTGQGEPRKVRGIRVTDGYFEVFGLPMLLGRAFTTEEVETRAAVTVLSHSFWQGIVGGEASVLGSEIDLDGEQHTVIGILPPEMQFPRAGRLFLPYGEIPDDPGHYLDVVARLAPEVEMPTAQAELRTIAATRAEAFPDSNKGYGVHPMGFNRALTDDVQPALWTLLAAVLAVLAIGCVNVANLTLARSARRRRELAVRAALGCGSGRLVRLLLVESLLVAAVGGALGTAFAWSSLQLRGLIPYDLPRLDAVALDPRILGFAALLTIGSGVAFGLAPAFWTARKDLNAELAAGRSPQLRGHPASRYLVAAEVALALVLVVTSGLLLRSFGRILAMDGGFDPENVLTMKLKLPGERYDERAPRAAFFEQVLERVESLPGVTSAGLVPWLPLEQGWNLGFTVSGREAPAAGEEPWAHTRWASPGYFETLGIPLFAGRLIASSDRADSEPVIVISRELARLHFPGEDPIGQTLDYDVVGGERQPRRIVGMVGDVKGLNARLGPMAYIPMAQEPFPLMTLAVKTAGPQGLADAVRSEIRQLDPLVVVDDVRTMDEQFAAELGTPRFTLQLVSGFALVALALAALGIYGVIAQLVSRRTAEIGLRMAVGATATDVTCWALARVAGMVAAGLAVGLVAAFGLTRLLEQLLYETSTSDPVTFVAVVLVLVAVAFLASLVPAWRATRIDPVAALRAE